MDHDHVPALIALLYLPPLLVLALALVQLLAARGWASAAILAQRLQTLPAWTGMASFLLLLAGTIHLGLVPGHLDQPVLAASFLAAGIVSGSLAAALLVSDRWRAPAGALLVALLAAYGWTRLTGFESVDILGVATCALEILAFALLARPAATNRTAQISLSRRGTPALPELAGSAGIQVRAQSPATDSGDK